MLCLLGALVSALAAYAVTVVRGERFGADSTIVLSLDAVRAINPVAEPFSNQVDTERLLGDEREFVSSREVFAQAADASGVDPVAIEEGVEVTPGTTANTILVRATAPTPKQARTFSEAVANAYVERRLAVRTRQVEAALASVDQTLDDLESEAAAGAGQPGANQQEYARWFAIKRSLEVQRTIGQDFAEIVRPPRSEERPAGLSAPVSAALAALLGAGSVWALRLLRRQSSRGEVVPVQAAATPAHAGDRADSSLGVQAPAEPVPQPVTAAAAPPAAPAPVPPLAEPVPAPPSPADGGNDRRRDTSGGQVGGDVGWPPAVTTRPGSVRLADVPPRSDPV